MTTITLTANQCRSLIKLIRFISNLPDNDVDNIRDEVIIKMVERLIKMNKCEA